MLHAPGPRPDYTAAELRERAFTLL